MNNTAEIKNNLHRFVVEINDISVLTQIQDYIKQIRDKKTDWYDELTQEQKESIERGLADADAGRVFSNEEVQKEVRALIESKRPA